MSSKMYVSFKKTIWFRLILDFQVPLGLCLLWAISDSFMIWLNGTKCHLITSSKTQVEIDVSNIIVICEEEGKLLEIYINNKLNFNYQLVNSAKRLGKNRML